MLTNRLQSRTARISSRGGFTLVELLVVIGIIAILAGVALGPITNGIKKAKQSGGLQAAHAIGVSMYASANDNSQLYPFVSGTSGLDYAKNLLAGGYVTDASIFYVGAVNGSTRFAYSGTTTSALSSITANNIAWDFVCGTLAAAPTVSALDSTTYTYLPVLWSMDGGATEPALATQSGDITATPVATAPFATDGLAVYYISNAAKFLTSVNASGTPTVTLVPSAANSGEAHVLTFNIHLGGT